MIAANPSALEVKRRLRYYWPEILDGNMYLAYPSAAASKDFEEPVGDKIPVFENITLCTGWAITFPPMKKIKSK
jgi:hypothetical protein